MVLDAVVWDGGMGDQIAIFVVWFWVGGVDDTYWDAVGQTLGRFDGCGDVGHVAVSGDV